MKKTISFIAISLLTASLLFGCKAKTVDNQNTNSSQNGTAQNNQNQGNFNRGGQFQMADLSGQVVSVKGNQVTIKIIKQPQFGQQSGNNSNNSGNNNSGSGNNNSTNNNNSNNNSNSNGNKNNSNNNSTNNNPNGNGTNQAPRQRRPLEFTGETKTLTIPAGTSITTMVRGNQGRETKQLKVTDIKTDDILQIWYTDKSKGTISRISVQEYGLNGNGNSNSNNNNNNNSNSSSQTSTS
jgi:hypothetical protein